MRRTRVRAAPNHAGFNLHPALFLPAVKATSKKALFAELVDALAERGVVHHRRALLSSLIERETLGTTAVGFGIAVPHGRSMVVGATTMLFARLEPALDYGALDGIPVHVALLIVAPYGATGAFYMPLLASAVAVARDDVSRRRLLEVETFKDFDKLMHESLKSSARENLSR